MSGVLGKVGQVTPSAVVVAVPPSAVGPNSPLLTTRTPPQRVSLRGGDVTSPFPSPGLLPGLFSQRLESAVDSLVNYLPTWQALPAGKWALGTIRSGFRLLWGHRRTPPFFGSTLLSPSSVSRLGSSFEGGSGGPGHVRGSRVGPLPVPGFGHPLCPQGFGRLETGARL